jgi:hypothetical protein
MKNYKTIVLAAIFSLLLPCLVSAKGSSGSSSSSSSRSSSSSSSMSRGFSSSSSSKPTQAPSQNQSNSSKPSFGSFGSTRSSPSAPAPSVQKSSSALSQSLEKNAAQSNALKTLDSKNTSKSASATPSDSMIGSRLGSTASTTPQYPSSSYQMPQAAPPVVYQNSGSSLNGMLTGYLVGRATSGGNNSYTTHQDISHQSTGDVFGNSSADAAIPTQMNYGPTVKTDSSDVAGGILKAIFWFLGIGALVCCGLLWWTARATRSPSVAEEARFRRNTNYSLK